MMVITGQGLSTTLQNTCEQFSLNPSLLRGEGYDGAAAMSGKFKERAKRISQKYPCAIYFHCASHVLNLAVCDACSVLAIRNCLGTMQGAIAFVR